MDRNQRNGSGDLPSAAQDVSAIRSTSIQFMPFPPLDDPLDRLAQPTSATWTSYFFSCRSRYSRIASTTK